MPLGGDRDFPSGITLGLDEEVITIDDIDKNPVSHGSFKYDYATSKFVEFTPDPVVLPPTLEEQVAAITEVLMMLI